MAVKPVGRLAGAFLAQLQRQQAVSAKAELFGKIQGRLMTAALSSRLTAAERSVLDVVSLKILGARQIPRGLLTIQKIARAAGISDRSAIRAVRRLVDLRILVVGFKGRTMVSFLIHRRHFPFSKEIGSAEPKARTRRSLPVDSYPQLPPLDGANGQACPIADPKPPLQPPLKILNSPKDKPYGFPDLKRQAYGIFAMRQPAFHGPAPPG